MNRSIYFNFIEEKLATLATRIELRGKLNILDYHLHSENFYMHFFNELFGWELQNLNQIQQNVEAIDLIDRKNKIVVQVSGTATRQKVESSFVKDLAAYSGYNFKFISISKDANALRGMTLTTPQNLKFEPKRDIYDVGSILKYIGGLEIDKLKNVYEFIQKELGTEAETGPNSSDNQVGKTLLKRRLMLNKGKEEHEFKLFGGADRRIKGVIDRLEGDMELLK